MGTPIEGLEVLEVTDMVTYETIDFWREASREAREEAEATLQKLLHRKHIPEDVVYAYLDHEAWGDDMALRAAKNTLLHGPYSCTFEPSLQRYRDDHLIVVHRIWRDYRWQERCCYCGIPVHRVRGGWRHTDPGLYGRGVYR
jgi:hypothetical protein